MRIGREYAKSQAIVYCTNSLTVSELVFATIHQQDEDNLINILIITGDNKSQYLNHNKPNLHIK